MTTRDAPDGVRKICEALAGRALEKCGRLGIDPADFYRAMKAAEGGDYGGGPEGVARLFEAAFRRLGVADG